MTRAAVAEAIRKRVDRGPVEKRRHLRIVDGRRLRRLQLGLFGTLMVVLVFVAVAALAAMQAFLVQGQLQLDQLDAQITQLEETKTEARLGVARLESPETVIAEAGAMGMIVPETVLFLQPRAGGPSGSGEAVETPVPELTPPDGSLIAGPPAVEEVLGE